jgi:hypothetical protein
MMRFSQSRTSALIALTVAFATVFALVGTRDRLTRRDRNGVIRMTRGGLQRLDSADAADAVSHDNSPDPTVARTPERASDLVVPSAGVPSASLAAVAAATPDSTDGHTWTGRAIVPATRSASGPPGVFVLLRHTSDQPPVLSRSQQPSLGRAPPSA